MDVKHIYRHNEVLVGENLINQGDAAINAALPNAEAGTVIYTAGYGVVKQKNLNGEWVTMEIGGGGGGAKVNAYDSIKKSSRIFTIRSMASSTTSTPKNTSRRTPSTF